MRQNLSKLHGHPNGPALQQDASTNSSQARKRSVVISTGSRTQLKIGSSNYRSSRTSLATAGSKKNLLAATKPIVQVFDEDGKDVTPLPMLQLESGQAVGKTQSKIFGGSDSRSGTPTDYMSQASVYQTTTSVMGGPFSKSVFNQSGTARTSFMSSVFQDDYAEGASMGAMCGPDTQNIIHHRDDEQEVLTEADLSKPVSINLSETATMWLLEIEGTTVSIEESASVREENRLYEQLCKNRSGNDRYMDRGMHTFNNPLKTKGLQTELVTTRDSSCAVSVWDMHDTYQLTAEMEAKAKQREQSGEDDCPTEALSMSHCSDPKRTEKASLGTTSTTIDGSRFTVWSDVAGDDASRAASAGGACGEANSAEAAARLLASDSLKCSLFTMERVVNLNVFQPKQAVYRGLQAVEDVDRVKSNKMSSRSFTGIGATVERLWTYSCPETKGHNVSCMTWNLTNPDLLAVSYGEFDYCAQRKGVICCWSVKNPSHPERVYTSPSGVTAAGFASFNPNLLAVGRHDGTVAVYNVRSGRDEPFLDSRCISSEYGGKHTAPVWQLRWVEKERASGENEEILLSVSTDGLVLAWSMRKGFESSVIMRLQRVATKQPGKKEKKGEAFISRMAGGYCFSFNPSDPNIYLVGTEEGLIHKCSCSYSEQYLDTYVGHTGAVYSVCWSPFLSNIFLSCSADWSLRLWTQNHHQPMLTLHSSSKAVHAVCWSPYCSTVFACVNEGALEIWDLAQSTLDPVIVNTPVMNVKLTSVVFSQNSECILVGDSSGQVTVFQLKGMSAQPTDARAQADALTTVITTSLSSQLRTDGT